MNASIVLPVPDCAGRHLHEKCPNASLRHNNISLDSPDSYKLMGRMVSHANRPAPEPQFGSELPFIYQYREFPNQQCLRIYIGHTEILFFVQRIVHVDDCGCLLLRSCGFLQNYHLWLNKITCFGQNIYRHSAMSFSAFWIRGTAETPLSCRRHDLRRVKRIINVFSGRQVLSPGGFIFV